MRVYLVLFPGGGCGSFIQDLILQCELQSNQKHNYSLGHAHIDLHRWLHDNTNLKDVVQGHPDDIERLAPTDSNTHNFIIGPATTFRSSQAIYQRDPENFRLVIITAPTLAESQLCEYNHFYKNHIHAGWGPENDYFQDYLEVQGTHWDPSTHVPPGDLRSPKMWQQVDNEVMTEIFRLRGQRQLALGHHAEEFKMRTLPHWSLTVKDIYFGRTEWVLDQISELVGRPVTMSMRNNYADYLQAQIRLRQQYPTLGTQEI